MQFKTNHSPGPWSFDEHDIRDKNGFYITDAEIIRDPGDIKPIVMIPAMLEYMMERAEYLNEITSSPDDSQFNDATKRNKAELKRILGILKDAGVEVVE